MLKVLVKKELAEIFRSYFYNAKKNKARSKGATVAYFVLFALLMAGVLGGMFAMLAKTLCAPLYAAGLGWLYFAMMGLIAVLLGLSAACSTPTPRCTCQRTTTCYCLCPFRFPY